MKNINENPDNLISVFSALEDNIDVSEPDTNIDELYKECRLDEDEGIKFAIGDLIIRLNELKEVDSHLSYCISSEEALPVLSGLRIFALKVESEILGEEVTGVYHYGDIKSAARAVLKKEIEDKPNPAVGLHLLFFATTMSLLDDFIFGYYEGDE